MTPVLIIVALRNAPMPAGSSGRSAFRPCALRRPSVSPERSIFGLEQQSKTPFDFGVDAARRRKSAAIQEVSDQRVMT